MLALQRREALEPAAVVRAHGHHLDNGRSHHGSHDDAPVSPRCEQALVVVGGTVLDAVVPLRRLVCRTRPGCPPASVAHSLGPLLPRLSEADCNNSKLTSCREESLWLPQAGASPATQHLRGGMHEVITPRFRTGVAADEEAAKATKRMHEANLASSQAPKLLFDEGEDARALEGRPRRAASCASSTCRPTVQPDGEQAFHSTEEVGDAGARRTLMAMYRA